MMTIYQKAAEMIMRSKYAIAFSGAGASAESGIPTFRDKGGVWEKYPVEIFGTPKGLIYVLLTEPQRFAEFLISAINTLFAAKPNTGHISLAELEELGILKAVITQNIDSLHQEGGSKRVIEVHGSITKFRCINCNKRENLSKTQVNEIARSFSERAKYFEGGDIDTALQFFQNVIPRCECGGIMRPDVVFFTEPVHNIDIAFEEARKADCCIVVGTSGVVYPAAYVPQIVKSKNGTIIEINPNQQSFDSDIYISESFSSAMPKIVQIIKEIKIS